MLGELNLELPERERAALVRAWHELDPWPDVVEGLTRLKAKHIVAPCSNAHIALSVNLAKYAALPWDAILGAELARAYKPQPEVYLRSVEALGLRPHEVCMVAAHNGDLRAAQRARAPYRLGHPPDRARAGPDERPRARGRLRRGRERLRRAGRAPLNRQPVPVAHRSPLPRQKADPCLTATRLRRLGRIDLQLTPAGLVVRRWAISARRCRMSRRLTGGERVGGRRPVLRHGAGVRQRGILATGAREGARYNYAPASPEILARVARIEGICARFGVPLGAAAAQFPLGHPVITSVVLGARRRQQQAANHTS